MTVFLLQISNVSRLLILCITAPGDVTGWNNGNLDKLIPCVKGPCMTDSICLLTSFYHVLSDEMVAEQNVTNICDDASHVMSSNIAAYLEVPYPE